jgi:hypothetical protein
VELIGADPDEETASSFTDISDVASAGLAYKFGFPPLLSCGLEGDMLKLWKSESRWLGDDEDEWGSKFA